MVEVAALEVAVPRVVAEDDALEPLNVGLVADQEPGLAGGSLPGQFAGALLAVTGVGMGGQERRHALARPLAHPLEHGVGRGNLARVVAGLGRVFHAELIGLGLVVAAVLEEDDPERALGGVAVAAESLRNDSRHAEPQPRDLLL